MKVNEWAGLANHNNAKFWEYDTRTAHRADNDPMPDPSENNGESGGFHGGNSGGDSAPFTGGGNESTNLDKGLMS